MTGVANGVNMPAKRHAEKCIQSNAPVVFVEQTSPRSCVLHMTD